MSRTPSPCLRTCSAIGCVRAERRREHEADLALLQQIAGPVADAGLGAAVGDQLEAERRPVVVAGLLGVADVELDVVGAVDREGVGCASAAMGMVSVCMVPPRGAPLG